MRFFRYIAIALVSFFLLSCGGGNGGASGTTKISLKINFDKQSKTAMKNQSRLIVSNTLINSVTIGYGPSGGAVSTVDATSAAEHGTELTLNNIELNKAYTFSISAFGADSVLVCEGSDTATVHSNGTTNISLTCSFKEKYAVENLAYDVMSRIADGNPMSVSELNGLVANDFVVQDGMSRSQYIQSLAAGSSSSRFLFSNVSLLKTEVIAPKAKDSSTTTNVRFFFSDGSYITEPMNFVKENDTWKITGNGRELAYEMYPEALALFKEADQQTPTMYTGYRFDVDSSMTAGYGAFTVDGTGISSAGLENNGSSFGLNPEMLDTYFNSANRNFIDVQGLENNTDTIPAGTVYTVSASGGSKGSITESTTMSSDGIQKSSLAQTMFPSATGASASGSLTYNVTLPTAFTPSRLELYAYVANYDSAALKNTSKIVIHSASVSSLISLSNPVFTINVNDMTGGAWTPEYGFIRLTAYDADGRAYSTYLSALYSGMFNADSGTGGGDTGGGDTGGNGGGTTVDYTGTTLNPGANTLNNASTMQFGIAPFIKSIYTEYLSGTDTIYSMGDSKTDLNGILSGASYEAANPDSSGNYDSIISAYRLDETSGTLYSKQIILSDHKTYSNANIMTDSSGNTYAVVQAYGTGNSTQNEVIISAIKIDGATQTIAWAKNYKANVTENSTLGASALSLDENSIIAVISGQTEVTVQKINTSDGSMAGGVVYSNNVNNSYFYCGNIAVARTTGRYMLGCTDSTGIELLALNTDLSLAGAEKMTSDDGTPVVSDMAMDESGNVYLSLTSAGILHLAKVVSDINQTVFSGFTSASSFIMNINSATYQPDGNGGKLTVNGDAVYVTATGYSPSSPADDVTYINKLSQDLSQVWTLRLNNIYTYSSVPTTYNVRGLSPAPLNALTVYFYGLVMGIPSDGTTSGLDATVAAATEDISVAPYGGMTVAALNPGYAVSALSFTTSDISITDGAVVKLFMGNYNMITGEGVLGAAWYQQL